MTALEQTKLWLRAEIKNRQRMVDETAAQLYALREALGALEAFEQSEIARAEKAHGK